MRRRTTRGLVAGLLLAGAVPGLALAAEGDAPTIDSGDTAWMLISTALVMVMLPGLALFYGGLVRRKNVLSTIMHSFFGLALVSIVWILIGFSLAFAPDVGGFGLIGGLDFVGFMNVGLTPSTVYATTIPFVLFAAFQLMFAAITPALITGAFAERKRFASFVIFTILWSIFVYSPIAHWVWAADGWLYKLRRPRLRRRHRRPRLVRRLRPDRGAAHRPAGRQRRPDGAARHPDDRPRRGAPVVRLVRVQRRVRGRRERARRERPPRDQHGRGRGDDHVGPRELLPPPQGQRRRRRVRRGCRPRRDHAGIRLRHGRRGVDHRAHRRRAVLRRDAPPGARQGRRRAGRLLRPRRRRDVRSDRRPASSRRRSSTRPAAASSTATRSRS